VATVADVVRTIDTPRGPLLVTVQRVAGRGTMRELTADDLLKAARVLFWQAALLSKQARRQEPGAETVDVFSDRSS